MNKYQEAIYRLWHVHFTQDIPEYAADEEYADWQLMKELVEKATPNNPIYEADGYADGELVYDTWLCPNCGKDYEVDYDKYDYCPKCGQRLDWSE